MKQGAKEVHEPGLGQISHRQGRPGFRGVRGGGAQASVEVLCRPSFGVVRLWPIPYACCATLEILLRCASIPLRCPLPGAGTPYLLLEDGVRGVGPYYSWAKLCVPSWHGRGWCGRHLWVVGGHGELNCS